VDAVPETRTSEQGNVFASELLRDFIRAALSHDAVEPEVMALLHQHVFGGRYHPSVVAESLRPMIDEIPNTATTGDWNRVATDLIAEARQALRPTPAP
jgi:hypothetical protein